MQRLVPEARVVVAHGQMGEDELERAMLDFIGKKYDVLLATTIIENGLDIPNVNTIIINRADRYGLSQLYQLRGRVGRSDRPAYAYLLIPPETTLSPIAKKRLAAIREFSDLGSGFRVAALDLEIRGAGNLLGGEQSGHIETVGFEMYMKLLEQAVRELKGEDLVDDVRAVVNLRVDLKIDESYVPDMNQRLMIYRKIADARTDDELDQILSELRDRYGPCPKRSSTWSSTGRIRIMADRLGWSRSTAKARRWLIEVQAGYPGQASECGAAAQGGRRRADTTLVPPATIKLDLRAGPKSTAPKTAAGSGTAAGRGWAPRPRPGRAQARAGGRPGQPPARSRQASRRKRFSSRRRKTPTRRAGCSQGCAVCWPNWPGYNRGSSYEERYLLAASCRRLFWDGLIGRDSRAGPRQGERRDHHPDRVPAHSVRGASGAAESARPGPAVRCRAGQDSSRK